MGTNNQVEVSDILDEELATVTGGTADEANACLTGAAVGAALGGLGGAMIGCGIGLKLLEHEKLPKHAR